MPEDTSAPLNFAIGAPGSERLLSQETRGRATLLLLLTTYDTASQLMALRLNELLHTFKPRVNVAAIVMEAAKYELLTETYRDTLGLDYKVVLADSRTMAGQGPLGGVVHIPTIILLDPKGRQRRQFAGPTSIRELQTALKQVLP